MLALECLIFKFATVDACETSSIVLQAITIANVKVMCAMYTY